MKSYLKVSYNYFSSIFTFFLIVVSLSCSNDTGTETPTPIPEQTDPTEETEQKEDADNDGVPDDEDVDDDGDGLIELFTIENLNEIRNDLSTSKKVLTGLRQEDFAGYEMTKDFDFGNPDDYADSDLLNTYTTGNGWMPIGIDNEGNSTPFDGVFEGNGFTIINLYIDNTEDFHPYGFFGEVGANSEIRNLALVNVSVNTESFNVAGLSGIAKGKIENCHVEGTVAGRSSVGLLIGSSAEVTISKCSTFGEVKGIDISVSESSSVGGLLGSIFLGNSNANPVALSASITACFSQATVNGNRTVGGLIGRVIVDAVPGTTSVSIRNCYATGAVTGSNGVGGFIAQANTSAEIQFCYWDTETSGIAALEDNVIGEGLTTEQLQTPTDASGIYAEWDTTVWNFGNSNQYPLLLNMPDGLGAKN